MINHADMMTMVYTSISIGIITSIYIGIYVWRNAFIKKTTESSK